MPLLAPEKPPLEPRNINPQLILLLKDLKLNPTIYSKDKTEQLLKPYRESGELEYLTKNKDVLEMMLRTTAATQPAPKPSYNPSSSTGRESFERTSQPQNYPQMGGYSHSFVPKADKYRTVPCKYYHRYFIIYKVILDVIKLIIAPISMMRDIRVLRCRPTTLLQRNKNCQTTTSHPPCISLIQIIACREWCHPWPIRWCLPVQSLKCRLFYGTTNDLS